MGKTPEERRPTNSPVPLPNHWDHPDASGTPAPETQKEGYYTVMLDDQKTPIDDNVEGGKGSKLRLMLRWGLNVPLGFIVKTTAFQEFRRTGALSKNTDSEMTASLQNLEAKTGHVLGDPDNPLIVSVRSGAKFSMPGAMETILNVGITDETLTALIKKIGEKPAILAYLDLIKSFGINVYRINSEKFEALTKPLLLEHGVTEVYDLPIHELASLVDKSKSIIEDTHFFFPQDAREQLKLATLAVFHSWYSPTARAARLAKDIPESIGTAVNVQEMVFGNQGGFSGSLVLLTRDPKTFSQPLVDIAMNRQGTATVNDESKLTSVPLENVREDLKDELKNAIHVIGEHYIEPQELEVTFFEKEDGSLEVKILQTRALNNLSPLAVLRFYRENFAEGKISESQLLRDIPTEYLNLLLQKLKAMDLEKLHDRILAKGNSRSPLSRQTGYVVRSLAEARQLSEIIDPRDPEHKPMKAILVANVSREDIYEIAKIDNIVGLVARNGALGTHLARVAEEQLANRIVVLLSTPIKTEGLTLGTQITADGVSGYVIKGEPIYLEEDIPTLPEEERQDALKWRDLQVENPWARVIPEFEPEDKERAARIGHFLDLVTSSLKEREAMAVQARVPEAMRFEFSALSKDATDAEIEDNIIYYVDARRKFDDRPILKPKPRWDLHNASVRTAIPSQGSSAWAAVTSDLGLESLFNPTSDPKGKQQVKPPKIEKLRSQPDLTGFLVGQLPADNTNKHLEPLHCVWNLAIDQNGTIYLTIFPHSQNMRAFNDKEVANSDTTITFTARYDPKHPGYLQPNQILVGDRINKDALARHQAEYVMKTIFEDWWGKGLGFAMSEMAVIFPYSKYSTPSLDGIARVPADKNSARRYLSHAKTTEEDQLKKEWCGAWGINADPKTQ